ncbi:MAG: methyltransferase domain-containing protein [Kiloniellales bacterium]|nr:methyltransferase domain-containing protein [Kiloniellales bacterium]
MPDLYAQITEVPDDIVAMLVDSLETRARDPEMVAMRRRYFDWLDLPKGARVVEIGAGPGDVTRDLAARPEVGTAVGLDPSALMVARAREKHGDVPGLSFERGDARELPFEDASFDAAVFHTCLCHVPGPDKALLEAQRILKPGGCLAVFDGDYATTTASLGEGDPLQNAVEATVANLVHDRWLVRSLEPRISDAGFTITRRDAHPYLSKGEHAYFLTLVDRGIDFLVSGGALNEKAGDGLKEEAQRRVETGAFFGFISFVSVIAKKQGAGA